MDKALLRLFNAVQAKAGRKTKHSKEVIARAARNGYILHPSIVPTDDLLNTIESIIGISGEKANASFHKPWMVVRDSPIEQLFVQQIVHYLTTYGFEALGVYHESTVYIPHETLELPEIRDDIPLVVIRPMTSKEILKGIIRLGSGVALSQQTLNDIMEVIKASQHDSAFVRQIKNRELKALLFDFYGLVPDEPVEYLRYLIAKLTGESLLIKNAYLIGKIKESDSKALDKLLKKAPDNLASIFFRYKPLFLALKSVSGNKTFFNRLRKLADTLHEPLPADYLNGVTAQIKREELSLDRLRGKLSDASVFRKIRLAYALKNRLNASNSVVYRVRNGRGWATGFNWQGDRKITLHALNLAIDSIAESIAGGVSGRTFYIPSNVHYALPATEKQFTGNLPTGSYVSVPEDMIVGIHWMNTQRRIDLDLSTVGAGGKYGWDADYRSRSRDVLFSGDMTDASAPNGASELFYFKKDIADSAIMYVNYYNFDDSDPVNCLILVAQEKASHFDHNYMVDVNNALASASIVVDKKQTVLGLIANIEGDNRFYFANVSVGNSITSSLGEQSNHVREFFSHSMVNSIDLADVLKMAGAKVASKKPNGEFVDLSPNTLDKGGILGLFSAT